LNTALGAINGFADLQRTTFGKVDPSAVLVSTREAGVAASNEVMDHQSSVDYARWLVQSSSEREEAAGSSHDHDHDHGHDHECSDPKCTDPSHDHSHDHGHDHDGGIMFDDNAVVVDGCGDPNCADPDCADPSHSHSHEHSHSHDRQETTAAKRFGIKTFVYSVRRPFVPERFEKLMSSLPFVRLTTSTGLPAADSDWSQVVAPSVAADSPFKDVLRSKGFVWLATESSTAMYWSQAGKQIEISTMGKWWAAVPRDSWPEAHVGSIMADFDGDFGDRRQEIVFIGANLPEAKIREALDACLAPEESLAELSETMASTALW
jgi:G3E family GTPase